MEHQLIHGDCFEKMKDIPDGYIDLIFADLPYGSTKNSWDSVLPLDKLWPEFKRLIKPNGCVVLTATQPFASLLVSSNLSMFKYEIIWKKTICSGQLNVKRQPLRAHESCLVFYNKQPIYNEQKKVGKPYKITRHITFSEQSYGAQKDSEKTNDGFRHAQSVIEIPNPRVKDGHPTQKPIALMDHFIKTFTDENAVVLDPVMGSGSTGVACKNLNRNFIGIELSEHYFAMANKRIYES